jgi:predicted RNase H-like nuclease (RuvC/YqgF family)
MATTWHGIVVAAALFGCQPNRDSLNDPHKSLRYPEHRKIEEHRIDELEAVTPKLVERLGSLEKQVTDLKTTVHELESQLAAQKAAPPPAQP